MADRALVFAKFCSVDAIQVDVCKDETHTLTNTVTDHPVEDGFNASDHSRPDPDQVTLTCFISNTPLSQAQMQQAVNEGAAVAQTTAAGQLLITDAPSRGVLAFNKLKKLRDTGKLVQVVTTLKTYGVSSSEGMMITSLTVPRTKENYNGLEFSITLKLIRVVRNKQSRQVKSKDTRVGKKEHQGAQPTKQPEDNKTLAAKGADKGAERAAAGGNYAAGFALGAMGF